MKTSAISSTGIMQAFAKYGIFVNIIPAMEYYYYVVYFHGREYYDGKINARMIMQTINQEKGLPLEPMILSRILNIVYSDLSRIGMVPFARE